MLRRINCISSCIKKQQNLKVNKVRLFRIANFSDVHTFSERSLSSEQEERILQIINDNTVLELNRYDIKKVVVNKLVSHRRKNGFYTSLEELKEIEGMDNNTLQKFYLSVLEGKKKTRAAKSKGGLLITPSVGCKHKNCHTTLGIHIGPDVVTWALLNHTYKLLEWNCDIVPQTLSDMNIINSIETAFEITKKIPVSDLYVFHDNTKEKRSRLSGPTFLGQSQFTAALVSYLAFRSGKSADNLFAIDHKMLARSFGLFIGNEIVSAQRVVDKLFDNMDCSDDETKFPRIDVGNDVMEAYDGKPAQRKEHMNWALLKAVAFVYQGIHNNPM